MGLSTKMLPFLLFLAGQLCLLSAESTCNTDRDLKDCGYFGITEEECKHRGCCWDPTVPPGEPWCFYKTDSENMEGEERHSTDHDTCCPGACRVDCGWAGMSKQDCLNRNCCWDPLEGEGTGPWCYHRNCLAPYGTYCDSGAIRVDCGHAGMNSETCEARNCCWSPLPKGKSGPYCFFRNAPPDRHDSCCTAESRRECGYCGIQQGQCEKRGCCWAPTGHKDDTWCFEKNCDSSGDKCNPSGPRKDCGYVGIDEEGCLANGCCWDPSDPFSDEPWCFVKNSDKETTETTEEEEETTEESEVATTTTTESEVEVTTVPEEEIGKVEVTTEEEEEEEAILAEAITTTAETVVETASETELETREEPREVAAAPEATAAKQENKDMGTKDTGAFLTRTVEYVV